MTRREKYIQRILSGRSDTDLAFADLVSLLESLGFEHRVRGSHHIFTKTGINERINLQADGPKAKRYQVKQIRDILVSYQIGVNKHE